MNPTVIKASRWCSSLEKYDLALYCVFLPKLFSHAAFPPIFAVLSRMKTDESSSFLTFFLPQIWRQEKQLPIKITVEGPLWITKTQRFLSFGGAT